MKPSKGRPPTRRRFLQTTATGLATASAIDWQVLSLAGAGLSKDSGPAHRELRVAGVHAYAFEESVSAGETIHFCVSATVPYRMSVCRLGLEVDDPRGDEVLHEFPIREPELQAIHPGSYVHVGEEPGEWGEAFSLECWLRPWNVKARAGLITRHDAPDACGVGLFLNERGGVSLYLGDGGGFQPERLFDGPDGRLENGRWHHIMATRERRDVALYLDGGAVGAWKLPEGARVGAPAGVPLRLGAAGASGRADDFLDGDLAMPVVYGRALPATAVRGRFEDRGLTPARGRDVAGCWAFSEERGARVADASRHRRHGTIINHATWMIGGPSFDAAVPRFDDYEPSLDSRRGHGLRLASDDLHDCGWRVTHSYRLPGTARSGLYVARLRFEWEGETHLQHVTFIVRRARRARPAPILVLAATNTWRAYSGTPFGRTSAGLKQVFGTGGTTNSPGDPPAFNFYRAHAAGQGTYQVGLRMPWPAAGPYVLYGGPTDYSHLMRAERFAQVWLERAGYRFEVVTDLDLHRDPERLGDHKVVLLNGHSEYWSKPMYDGLERYLRRGGNVICLSGNSLFWRVSFNDEGTVLECRKVDAPGDQLPASRRGECWHSQDGRRGGLLRECGSPGWRLIGLETLGWNNQGDPRQFGPYHVGRADHFLFREPEEVGVMEGEAIGQAPDGGLPRANGHEIDVRLSTLAALQEQPTPEGQAVPGDPEGMVRLANGVIPWKIGGAAFDYFFRPIKPANDQGGEMIYWERPAGGRVFNAGSIGSGWALHADPRFQALMRNVLHHFGVRRE